MIRQRHIQHKRKNSQIQLFHPIINQNSVKKTSHSNDLSKQISKSSQNKKLKIPRQDKSTNQINGKNVLKLVEKSSKIRDKKLTVIQDIDHNNQNIDHSNHGLQNITNGLNMNDESTFSFFQFGRRSISSYNKQQKISPSTIDTQQYLNKNVNYELSMEQIVQVPDTMSNSKRYDSNGKFYQFTTMMQKQNTERKISTKNELKQTQFQQKKKQTINQMQKCLFNVKKQKQEINRNLNKRKQKQPKLILDKESLEKDKFADFSLMSCNSKKKSKPLLLNNRKKDQKSSKSKQGLKSVIKQKLNISNMCLKKQKNIESQGSLIKKKSLSLKQKNKSVLKLSSEKSNCLRSYGSQNKSEHSLSINRSKKSHQKQNMQGTKNLKINEKIQLIEETQSKLQTQYKVLWECVGELWQNNRITRYISQKNKSDIMKLQEQESKQDTKLINLKSQIMTAISSARY